MGSIRRSLTPDELRILALIAELYGSTNTVEAVFFTDRGEAAIFARNQDGEVPIMVNLTNVASFSRNDALTDEQIVAQWLRVPETR